MRTRCLGVAGRNGAGKDALVDYLAERCGVVKLSAGALIREMAAERDLAPTRENLHDVSVSVTLREGRDAIARRLIAVVEDHQWAAVAVSGVRSPYDAQAFQLYFGDAFRLVHVRVGDARLRFERLRQREDERDPQNWERFCAQEHLEEAHFEISRTLRLADVTIDNHDDRRQLHRNIAASPIMEWICSPTHEGADR
jgi:dephospho-CoA kinase